MENVTLKFPHLSEMIFDHLENQSLANCDVVSKIWSIYIGEQKFYGIRIIKETVKKYHKLSKPWFEVFKKGSTKNIMDLRNCFAQFEERRRKLQLDRVLRLNREVTPLHVSADGGNFLLYESIYKIAKNKQPKTEDGSEPVIYAIRNYQVEMALFLIERMVDENPEARILLTALDTAAKFGLVEVCESILKHLQDKNSKLDYLDGTPLHIAAIDGHISVCKLIMKQFAKNNCEKNPRDNDGLTTFHFAAFHGRLEICELFMNTIRNKHPRTNKGDTPLHLAARNGHVKVCMLILQSVRCKNPRNHRGKTPLTTARENNQFKVCWLLEKIWNCVT